jgi:hypothetical protein
MAEFGFGPPLKEEEHVFGSQRPGFPGKFVQKQVVDEWIAYMKKQGVRRVVCLLSDEELGYYPTLVDGLLGAYVESFGPDNVLWAPSQDRRLLSEETIRHLCHFMHAAVMKDEKTVVHCSAGLGRTGQALAAWLVYYHNLSERKAIKAVEELNRSPMEAVFYRTASEADMLKTLGAAREMDKLVQ